MPFAPPHPCNHPGCRELTTERYCPAHTKQVRRQSDANRESAHSRGYGRDWQRLRLRFVSANPLCADPFGFHQGRPTPARDVDHIIPHRGDEQLRMDWNNLQSLCHRCHSYKTATEDGAFGNARKMPKGGGGSNLQGF